VRVWAFLWEANVRTTYITALIIAAVVVLWLFSGQARDSEQVNQPSLAIQNSQMEAAMDDGDLARVRAKVIHASMRTTDITVRGKTENKRTVTVKAETRGRIIARPVERGNAVDEGELLCRISVEDRNSSILEASAGLNQATIDYKGALKLQKRGLQSETGVATAKTRLVTAKAQLARAELELARTEIRAPFAGLIEDTHVEDGDYIQAGSPCVTLVDLDPMLMVGQVAERNVHRLKIGESARGTLINGTSIEGKIKFIGHQASEQTRTYTLEIEVPNSDYAIRSGFTAEIKVGVDAIMAHQISPALLALDDEGSVGVRRLDSTNRVIFDRVEILSDDDNGIWVAGLPETTTLITVGQELVVPNQEVEVSYEGTAELRAQTRTRPETALPTAVPAGPAAALATDTSLTNTESFVKASTGIGQ